MNPLAPKPTPLDLNWRMFGIHVRVSPWFWAFAAGFGLLSGLCVRQLPPPQPPQILWPSLLTWIGCTFFSVLIHELGHVTMGRLCGQKGDIILHGFGGLAIGHYELTRRWQQMAIALAGPAAGLCLFATIWLLVHPYNLATIGLPDVRGPQLVNWLDPAAARGWPWRGADYLLLMNFMWNVLNLVPILPMDGGQTVRAALHGDTSPKGLRIALGVSFLTASALAVHSFLAWKDPTMWYPGIPSWATLSLPGLKLDPFYNGIVFAILAVSSFKTMMSIKREETLQEQEDRDLVQDRY